jgi:penicillin-binding protein 1A
LTQQLARGFFLSQERTYSRKLKEFFIALNIERNLEKERILELYCNPSTWAAKAATV